ncbi:RsbRD N-terminal domain-containing protein [Archangium violaceum]|uniref:RsbRD N-terminal domain-containing protein n=1 Tax=Archangium violaceum TaxID=83451 RepID=UPI0019501BAC|nr:RsbRD N-terminal domain-containing protein [Archangium violaceum]QRN95676.1 RsbRD N-terminal domain-containing protein [Archangium violaceum]
MFSVADLMEAHKERLFARWLEQVRRHHAPGPLSEPELANHFPDFLREVIAALHREEEGEAPKTHRVSPLGWEHGEQRFRTGFDLSAVVREYGSLQECILDLVEESGHGLIRVEDVRILEQCFNRALADAVAHFLSIQEREHAQAASPPAEEVSGSPGP